MMKNMIIFPTNTESVDKLTNPKYILFAEPKFLKFSTFILHLNISCMFHVVYSFLKIIKNMLTFTQLNGHVALEII